MKSVFKVLTELTSNRMISRATGKLAKTRASRILIKSFVRTYRINVDEAEKPLHQYSSLNAFFTRRLKPGARIVDAHHQSVISPVDARIMGIGRITDGTLLYVKGQTYTLAEILNDPKKADTYRHGQYIVLYLSPSDYHRIHAPISGWIKNHVHLKGKVYPVNEFGLRHMKRVLSRNESLITYISNERMELAMIKVGAMNVASIQLSDRLTTSRVEKGDEIAYFEFGSTVILLMKEGEFEFEPHLKEGVRLRFGERIGTQKEKKSQHAPR